MDFTPDADCQALAETVAKICAKYGRAYYLDCIEKKKFAWDLWRELAGIGCWGLCVPEDHGGTGLGMRAMGLVFEVMARHGMPITLADVGPALAGTVISRHGRPEQVRRYLPRLVSGDGVICFAITEPHAGTNTFKIKTFAEKVAGGYRLNGEKVFISGFDVADYALVVTRTAPLDAAERTKGLSLMMVDPKADGVTKSPLNIEAPEVARKWQVYFNDVFVPEDALIGEEGQGLRPLFDGLNPERIMACAMCVGLGEYALDLGVDYAKTREVFDGPIGAYQSVQHPFAEAYAQLELARLMNRKAAWEFDRGETGGVTAILAKLAGSDAGVMAAEAAIQAHGGNGFVKEYDLVRLWAFLRLQKNAPIARQMTLNHIAEHALGLPKSY